MKVLKLQTPIMVQNFKILHWIPLQLFPLKDICTPAMLYRRQEVRKYDGRVSDSQMDINTKLNKSVPKDWN